jgi:hypothetical protein
MKMVKSLILGSAAGLVAMSGAQAADLPVKAKAVEYVRICSLYGAGFYYIPGTDTCIKLGGYLRVDVAVNTNSVYTGNTSGAGGAKNRFSNAYTWRSREDLNIDTRTATEYGVLRTYFDATFTWTSGSFAGTGLGGTTYAGDGVAGGFLGVYYAFIQFAGFTIGKAVSQFSAPWVSYPGNNLDGLVGGGGSVTGVNQFTYTAQFGNGVSASISAQDQTGYFQAGVQNVGTDGVFGLGAYGVSNYAGTGTPDIVGQLRVDQAWGLFQLSAAAHNNHVAYYGGPGVAFSGTELAGHPDDRWGWAVQAALSIKNIPTGPGDTINVQGVYTDGATRYNIQDLAGGNAGAPLLYGSSGVAYQSVALGLAPDTVFGTGTEQQLVQTWGMRGAYTHNWNPFWNSAVYGAYAQVHYSGGAKDLICGVGGVGGSFQATLGAGVTTCNPDYNIAQLGFITRWTPVKGLTFSGDFNWTHIDQKHEGFINAGSAAIGKPSLVAGYELKDQDNYQLLLRAQRNW